MGFSHPYRPKRRLGSPRTTPRKLTLTMAYDVNSDFKIPLGRRLFFKLNGPNFIRSQRAKKRAKIGVSEDPCEVVFTEPDRPASELFGIDWGGR